MQAYPEGGVQNNKGWVSVMAASPHPSCVLTDSCLSPYPVQKVAFPVIPSQQHIPNRPVLLTVSFFWKLGESWKGPV